VNPGFSQLPEAELPPVEEEPDELESVLA